MYITNFCQPIKVSKIDEFFVFEFQVFETKVVAVKTSRQLCPFLYFDYF